MRKIVVSEFVSLDGVMEDPGGAEHIDQYRLLVYPIVLGSGKRLFPEGHRMPLRLIDTQTFSCGVVALTYQPADHGENA